MLALPFAPPLLQTSSYFFILSINHSCLVTPSYTLSALQLLTSPRLSSNLELISPFISFMFLQRLYAVFPPLNRSRGGLGPGMR